jgi:hypothetical protein
MDSGAVTMALVAQRITQKLMEDYAEYLNHWWKLRPDNDVSFPMSLSHFAQHSQKLASAGFVPAPRLVGIEPNPGPGPRGALAALSAGMAALGSAVARTHKKKKTTKRKLPAKLNGPRKRARGERYPTTSSQNTDTGNVAVAGATSLTTMRPNRFGSLLPSIIVPFDCLAILLATNASSVLGFSVNTTSNSISFDLNPTQATGGGLPFGVAISQLATCYDRFRVRKLRVHYNPLCSTTTASGALLAYSPDPWITGGTYTPYTVGSLADNTPFAFWEPKDLEIRNLDKTWKYCYESVTNTAAESRQDCAGSLIVAPIGTMTASTIFGSFQFSGEIEFTGLGANNFLDLEDLSAFHKLLRARANRTYSDSSSSSSSSTSASSSSSLANIHEEYTLVLAKNNAAPRTSLP